MRTSRERDIDTTVEGVPCDFSAVGIELRGIDRIPMIITHRQWPWPEDCIYFFGRDAQATRYGAQVFIQVYPLPDGIEKFREALALYLNQKKGFLVEGSKFNPSFLLPRFALADFERESFQTRDGIHRRRIVHLFEAQQRAIILVYSLNSAHFGSSVFFRQVSESLEISKQ
jgi:hypothetical protein